MDKYDAANDHYCYGKTSVLKNILEITDTKKLENAERDITNHTSGEVVYRSPPYDLNYLQSLHCMLFSPLYDWAGCIRDVNVSKASTTFCIYLRIESEINKLFALLAKDNWLNGIAINSLSEKLAEYYCEFNMIHPFREGNGRVQRLFFEHLVLSTGHELDWSHVTQEEWVIANIDGVYVNYEPMTRIFAKALS